MLAIAFLQQFHFEVCHSDSVHILATTAKPVGAVETNASSASLIRKIVVVAAVVTGLMCTVTASMAGDQCGGASWYGPGFHGKKTASGERYNQNAMTAAHKTLPFGTIVKVTDQTTGKSVKVTINDRGPFHKGRIIDLSRAAADRLGTYDDGVGKVCVAKS